MNISCWRTVAPRIHLIARGIVCVVAAVIVLKSALCAAAATSETTSRACKGVRCTVADLDRAYEPTMAELNDACETPSDPKSCTLLAVAEYLAGHRSLSAAASRRGCDLGYGAACTASALFEKHDDQPEASLATLEDACQKGDPEGCKSAISIIGVSKTLDPGRVVALRKRAFTLAQRGCETRDDTSCSSLGSILPGLDSETSQSGEKTLKNACESRVAEACFQLAIKAYGKKELKQAYFAKACAAGHAYSCRKIGKKSSHDVVGCGIFETRACLDVARKMFARGASETAVAFLRTSCRRDFDVCRGAIREFRDRLTDEQIKDFAEPVESFFNEGCTEIHALDDCDHCSEIDGAMGRVANVQTCEKQALTVELSLCQARGGTDCSVAASRLADAGRFQEAQELALKSCQIDSGNWCYGLTSIGNKLLSQPDTSSMGIRFLDTACRERRDCSDLIKAYKSRNSIQQARDTELYSCEAGNLTDCISVANFEESAGNFAAAFARYQMLCDKLDIKHFVCGEASRLARTLKRLPEVASVMASACAAGDDGSCFQSARIAEDAGDTVTAKKIYTRLCGADDSNACNNLAAIAIGIGNTAEAKRMYSRACDAGNGMSCSNLAYEEQRLGNKPRARVLFRRSRSLLNKECDSGDNESCSRLADLARDGF